MMRAALLALMLLASAFAGCIQEGERIGQTDVGSTDDTGQEDDTTQDDAGADDTSGSDETDSEDSSSSGNQTAGGSDGDDASDGTDTTGGNGTGGQADGPTKEAWSLSTNLSLGFEAGVGASFAPEPVGSLVGDNGVISDTRCPAANVTVPKGASSLTIEADGALVDADEPGVGAYEIEIAGPDGENATIGGLEAVLPAGGGTMNHTSDAPAPGTWQLEANMAGPAVQQTWSVTVTASGDSVTPPSELAIAFDC